MTDNVDQERENVPSTRVGARSRRGPGRPAIGGRVSVNLGDDLLAELDRIAQVQGMERSELIRQLLDAALARL